MQLCIPFFIQKDKEIQVNYHKPQKNPLNGNSTMQNNDKKDKNPLNGSNTKQNIDKNEKRNDMI